MNKVDVDLPRGWVWVTEFNNTGIPSKHYGYVMLIGLLSALFAFAGYEAGAHLAEETKNASISAPWGIVATCCTVAATGFFYIVGMLYATPTVLGPYAQYWPTAYSVVNTSMACESPDTPGCGVNDYLSTALATAAASGAPGVYVAACGEKTGLFLLASEFLRWSVCGMVCAEYSILQLIVPTPIDVCCTRLTLLCIHRGESQYPAAPPRPAL